MPEPAAPAQDECEPATDERRLTCEDHELPDGRYLLVYRNA